MVPPTARTRSAGGVIVVQTPPSLEPADQHVDSNFLPSTSVGEADPSVGIDAVLQLPCRKRKRVALSSEVSTESELPWLSQIWTVVRSCVVHLLLD